MLDVDGLVMEYRREGLPFRAVDGVSLRADRGEMIGIVGRSGSGKTTFLSMVAGLQQPSAGRVCVAGTDIYTLPDARRSRLRNRSIGFVPQGQSLVSTLTVFDNVRLPHYFASGGDDGNIAGRTRFLLDELGIGHLAGMLPRQLSGGEMRRTAIARAMMNRPELLLADEPTGDLDPDNARAVMAVLGALAGKGVTVLFSTHEAAAAAQASRVVRMTAGAMAEQGKREG